MSCPGVRPIVSFLLALSLLLLPAVPASAAAVSVTDVRTGQYTDYTRVVIETNGTTTYTHAKQTSPDRIEIDVSNAVLGIAASTTDVDDGTVREVRWSQYSASQVRVVIETEVAATYTISTLSSPFRIVIDVTKQKSTSPAPSIRIGLLSGQTEVSFSGTGAFDIINLATGGKIATGSANTTWKVRAASTGYAVINSSGTQVGTYTGPIRIKLQAPTSYQLVAKSLKYRGEFEVKKNSSGTIALINELDTESYLYGVVPKEMPSTWHGNALKAQAVTARTYARANMGKRSADGFDLYDSTSDQVYGGYSAEQASSNTAVNDTRGVTAIYNGTHINALFFSTAGGHTEHNENVFGGTAEPYLRGVPLTSTWESASPYNAWTASITKADMQTKLNADPATNVGTLSSITFRGQGVSGRWLYADITGSGGTKTVTSNKFRIVVGASTIKSTWFTMTLRGDYFDFSGQGYGHGVGLSQYGAKGAAEAGLSYRKIMRAFFTDGTRFKIEY